MEVSVRVFGHVVVEDDVDPLDVHAPAKQVGGHQDAPLEVLELLVARESAGEKGGARVSPQRRKSTMSQTDVGDPGENWLTRGGLIENI